MAGYEMRNVLPDKLRKARVEGEDSDGPYGAFVIQGPCGERLVIIANDAPAGDVAALGWEHVSVSTRRRAPNWTEMCFVKDLFWDEEEAVVQFHPPRSQYVNIFPYCLHLWRHKSGHQTPPSHLVF